MKKINLNFLDNPNEVDHPNLIEILEDCGRQISEYGKEYFNYVVTHSSIEGVLKTISLYVLAPEIAYDCKVINVEIVGVSNLKISFYTLLTRQIEIYKDDISKGTDEFENKLDEILSNSLFNASLKFLVNQIHLRRQHRDDVQHEN